MKLPKPVDNTSHKAFIKNTVRGKLKMKQVGQGAFARVFGRADYNRVIKIGVEYDQYLTYVSLIGIKNPNPYFPKIHSIKRFKSDEGLFSSGYYVVEMERLTPWNEVPQAARKKQLSKLGCDVIWDTSNPKVTPKSSRWEKQAVKLLNRLFSRKTVSADCHQGNIMFRKVGKGWQMVYTDPVA